MDIVSGSELPQPPEIVAHMINSRFDWYLRDSQKLNSEFEAVDYDAVTTLIFRISDNKPVASRYKHIEGFDAGRDDDALEETTLYALTPKPGALRVTKYSSSASPNLQISASSEKFDDQYVWTTDPKTIATCMRNILRKNPNL